MVRRALFTCALVLVTLVLGEVASRVFFALPMVAGQFLADDDYTWRRNWVRRHAEGREIYYAFDIYHPQLGWVSRPLLRDERVFGDKFLNTNSRSLRGVREFPYERVEGTRRILVLGDSFTFGDEVSDNQTYPHLLQEMLPEAEVINMGVHGYGHDQMLLLLQEEGVRYRPDLIILGFVGLDMGRNLLRFRDFAKPTFAVEGDQLVRRGIPVPSPEEVLRWDWARPRLIDALSMVRYRLNVSLDREEARAEGITRRILEEIANTSRSIGAEPVFVYLPEGNSISSPSQELRAERFLLDFLAANPDVHGFSAYPYFSEAMARGVEFKTIGHWGPPGHETVAQAIFDYLSSEGFLNEPAS